MYKPHLVKHLSTLKLTKTYLLLSLLYGISTLIVPFATQMLVNDLALTGLCSRRGIFGRISRADRERAYEAIARVGLDGFEDRSIRTLSGGQLQRLLFARLMLQDAPLILLDEPFAAIDQRTIADLLVIIENWHAEGRTILCVLHDFEVVRQHFPQSLLIAREPIAWGATATVLTDANLSRARTMSEAFDREAAFCERAA